MGVKFCVVCFVVVGEEVEGRGWGQLVLFCNM